MKKRQRRITVGWLLKSVIGAIALFLVFEEWLWDALKTQLHRFSRLPLVGHFEGRLRQLPPWASLMVLVIPGASLLPFKIVGIWALANGHPILGVAIFILAKVTGTALAAYLFDLVRDRARELLWFNSVYLRVICALQAARSWLADQPAYQAAMAIIVRIKDWIRGDWNLVNRKNRWQRLLALAKRRVFRHQSEMHPD